MSEALYITVGQQECVGAAFVHLADDVCSLEVHQGIMTVRPLTK